MTEKDKLIIDVIKTSIKENKLTVDEGFDIIASITEKEIDTLVKEKEFGLKIKETEKEVKDVVINSLEKEIHYLNEMMGKEKELFNEKTKNFDNQLLMAESACTSRGILEYYLKAIDTELSQKPRNFNAKAVCDLFISKFCFLNISTCSHTSVNISREP
jgi:hypothetical protein